MSPNGTIMVPGLNAQDYKESQLGYSVEVKISTTAKGMPTPELKVCGMQTKETVDAAIAQYKRLREQLEVEAY